MDLRSREVLFMVLFKETQSKLAVALSFLIAVAMAGPLAADQLRVTGGVWAGEVSSELEKRFMMDDIITDPSVSAGRLDLPWGATNTYSVFPLSLQYQTGFWKGDLVFTASYLKHNPDYGFTGIVVPSASAIGIVSLDDYIEENIEGDVGYQIKLIGGKLFLTPRIGYRHHAKSFTYNEITLGNPVGMSINGPFSADARNIFLGVGAQFFITPQFSVVGDIRQSSPVLGDLPGSMSFELTRAYTNGSFTWDRANSDMTINFRRIMIAGQYDFTKDFHIQAGIMTENLRTEYPDYNNIPLTFSGGAFNVNAVILEILSDNYLVYPSAEESEKGMVFLAASYDFDI